MIAARLDEEALIAAYDRALTGASGQQLARLNVERAVHATHLAALKAYPPSAGRAGEPLPAIPVSKLPAALRASAATNRHAALAATDGNNAALLASIAASHEVSAGG
jgi:hypothetical protein